MGMTPQKGQLCSGLVRQVLPGPAVRLASEKMHQAGAQEPKLLELVSYVRADHSSDSTARCVTLPSSTRRVGMLRNASLQLAKALSTSMPEPRPQPPGSGKVSCGCHAVPRALVAESQVWTVGWKWQEPSSLPRMNPLVCKAGRAKRNSHRMQRTLTTLSPDHH